MHVCVVYGTIGFLKPVYVQFTGRKNGSMRLHFSVLLLLLLLLFSCPLQHIILVFNAGVVPVVVVVIVFTSIHNGPKTGRQTRKPCKRKKNKRKEKWLCYNCCNIDTPAKTTKRKHQQQNTIVHTCTEQNTPIYTNGHMVVQQRLAHSNPKEIKKKSKMSNTQTHTHARARARRERAHSDGARVQELNLKN